MVAWCMFCGQDFIKPEQLERHVLTHLDGKAFKCNICDVSFKRRDLLVKHQSLLHTPPLSLSMTPLQSHSPPQAQRRPIACVSCARAKTKCDKTIPSCSRCTSKRIPCAPRSTRRACHQQPRTPRSVPVREEPRAQQQPQYAMNSNNSNTPPFEDATSSATDPTGLETSPALTATSQHAPSNAGTDVPTPGTETSTSPESTPFHGFVPQTTMPVGSMSDALYSYYPEIPSMTMGGDPAGPFPGLDGSQMLAAPLGFDAKMPVPGGDGVQANWAWMPDGSEDGWAPGTWCGWEFGVESNVAGEGWGWGTAT